METYAEQIRRHTEDCAEGIYCPLIADYAETLDSIKATLESVGHDNETEVTAAGKIANLLGLNWSD